MYSTQYIYMLTNGQYTVLNMLTNIQHTVYTHVNKCTEFSTYTC